MIVHSPPARFKIHPLRRLALAGGILAVFAGYLLQSFSPLRVTPDALAYLQMARTASEGLGFQRSAYFTYQPVGYPAMIAALIKMQLGHPAAIVVLNVLWLAIAAAACYWLFRRGFEFGETPSSVLVLVSLLSWVVIKHAAFALSECCFLGAAVSALAFLEAGLRTESRRAAAVRVCAAAGCTALALSFRTAGLALLPPLFSAAFVYWRRWRKDAAWGSTLLIAAGSILAGLAVGLPLMGFYSFSVYSGQAQHAGLSVVDRLSFRVQELGEMAFSLPASLLVRLVPSGIVKAAGAVFGLLVCAGFVKRRRLQPVDIFVLCYLALVLQWPYYDARFWIPLIPFLPAYLYVLMRAFEWRGARVAAAAWLALIVAGGVFALSYSVWLGTQRGVEFANRYGSGSLRNTYCAAFGDCSSDPARPAPDPRAVEILRFYR